jgi:hypothetical protein
MAERLPGFTGMSSSGERRSANCPGQHCHVSVTSHRFSLVDVIRERFGALVTPPNIFQVNRCDRWLPGKGGWNQKNTPNKNQNETSPVPYCEQEDAKCFSQSAGRPRFDG